MYSSGGNAERNSTKFLACLLGLGSLGDGDVVAPPWRGLGGCDLPCGREVTGTITDVDVCSMSRNAFRAEAAFGSSITVVATNGRVFADCSLIHLTLEEDSSFLLRLDQLVVVLNIDTIPILLSKTGP